MKQLILGNAAVARGLYEAGCRFVSAYPGTPSTEIAEEAAKFSEIYCEWAPNEKVALEASIGASIGGARSFCAMKHVGLNVAADPLFTVSYTGVNGGMVIAVADDPGMHSSQNEQDSRHYAIAAKLPMLEDTDGTFHAITTPLTPDPDNRLKMVISPGSSLPGSKPAVTLYSVLKSTAPGSRISASLVMLRLKTGRTHQIRVQLSHAGYPLIGDLKYGTEESIAYSENQGIKTVVLCAFRLVFVHPKTNKQVVFEI